MKKVSKKGRKRGGGGKANMNKKAKKQAKPGKTTSSKSKQPSKSKPAKKSKKETTSNKQTKVQQGKKAETRLKGGIKAGHVEPPGPSKSGKFNHLSRIVIFIPCHDTAHVPNLHFHLLSRNHVCHNCAFLQAFMF